MSIAVCPARADLERLFLGGLPESETDAIEQHMQECRSCGAKLADLLAAKDTLVDLLSHDIQGEAFASTPVVADLVKRLKSLPRATADSVQQGNPMITIACSACHKKLSVNEDLTGKKVKCPGCGQLTMVSARIAAAVGKDERTLSPHLAPGESPEAKSAESQVTTGEHPTHPPLDKPDATQGVDGSGMGRDGSLTDFLAPAETADELGRLGAFRIIKILGHGGMGVVFLGEDAKLGRKVAIKAMLPHLAQSKSSQRRFLREAKAAAALEHDHIVAIHHVGEDRGAPYIVMPFLKGQPLDERLKAGGPMALADILRIGREIAEGLGAAHATGLIHRDIKPANIWLEAPRDRVKILDFGLARAATQEAGLTQQGAIIGTPAYMAPEQGRGDTVDARCDLFSLGVVLYRLCTGQQPFHGKDTVSTLMAVAMSVPVAPIKLNGALPPELSELVMKLLAKDPDQRVASAAEVIQALQGMEKKLALQKMAEEKTEALNAGDPEHGIITAPNKATRSGPPATKAPAGSGKRRRPAAYFAVALAAVFAFTCLLGGGIFYIVTDNGTIEIKTDDPNIKIIAEDNGGKVTILDPASKQTWILNTGKYTVKLDGNPDGLEIDLPAERTFEMKRGGKQVVSIRKVPAPVAKVEPKTPSEKSHALQFTGDDVVTIPTLKLDDRGPITIEAYCRCDSVAPGKAFNPIVLGIPACFSIYFEHDGLDLRAACNLTDQETYRIVHRPWAFGERHHLAAVRTKDQLRLYVDGRLVGSKSLPDLGLVVPQESFRIGGRVNGEIGEIRISKTARYPKNFTPAKRFEPDADTLALYHFDEGQGDVLKDSSGNKHNGKIVGAKWVKAEGTQIVAATPEEIAAKKQQEDWAATLKLPVEATNKIGMKLRLIPPGDGVAKAFYLGKYEVTQGEWEQVMGYNPSLFGPKNAKVAGLDTSKLPVDAVSWYDSVEYCNKLSEREGLRPYYELTVTKRSGKQIDEAEVKILGGSGYHIPTDAEWEHGCRAGTKTKYHFGEKDEDLLEYAWFDKNSDGRTHAVGEKKPNAFGLYDMHGNVREWNEEMLTNAKGAPERVMRGGNWSHTAGNCPVSIRNRYGPAYRHGYFGSGLRLARVADGSASAAMPPLDPAWLKAVAPLPAGEQQKAMADKLSLPVEATNKLGMKLRLIPPGVGVAKAFYLGKFEVTQGEWQPVMGYNPSAFGPTNPQVKGMDTGKFPVETVSWYDSVDYCNKLSEREGLKPYYELTATKRKGPSIEAAEVKILGGSGYHIPTDAEWEHGCRAGTKTKYHCGDKDEDLLDYAWFDKNSEGRTHAVGEKKPNGFGLYDMHGNVPQWNEEMLTNASTGAAERVARGGSWNSPAGFCAVSIRHRPSPASFLNFSGLRVARAADGSASAAIPPLDPVWLKAVAAMKPEQQVEAVKAELIRRNPGFNGKIRPVIDKDGVVTELEFLTDNVTDIAPVRALTELRYLNCSGAWNNVGKMAPFADLSPLKGMKLTRLDCFHTQVSDLSPLQGMPLTYLSCYVTRVTDLTPLKDMKLTSLTCRFSKVTDLSPLKGMPLEALDCDFEVKRDAEILRSIKTLEKINGKTKEAFWKDVDQKKP